MKIKSYFPLLLLIWSVVLSCREQAPGREPVNTVPRQPWKMVCLGDDWTIGSGLTADTAYPALLAEKLKGKERAVKIVNAGISRETVGGAAVRVDWILQQRMNALLLAYGAISETPIEVQLTDWELLLTKIRRADPDLPVLVMDTGFVARKGKAPEHLTALWKKYEVVAISAGLSSPEEAPELWQVNGEYPSVAGQRSIAAELQKILQARFDEL